MNSNFDVSTLPGASELIAAFDGSWPSFHDAEVIALSLDRKNSSWLKLHTWKIMSHIDSNGYLARAAEVIVTFTFENIADIELSGFNQQNVIAGLDIEGTDELLKLSLLSCFGLYGTITAEKIFIQFESAKPEINK